jgi:protein required for attachment to host cells
MDFHLTQETGMADYCVVVSNGSRARFFTLEDVEFPEVQGGPNLREHKDLLNPEKELPGKELWSESKSGRNQGGSGAHGYDDHRDNHRDEYERRFARALAEQSAQFAQDHGAKHVVLVAEKQMLGFLRSALDPLLKAGIQVSELAKDYSKISPTELHQYLARENLVPERKNPAA